MSVDPVEPITFKMEGESDWHEGEEGESDWHEGDTEAKQSIEFELVWSKSASTAEEGTLDIELVS